MAGRASSRRRRGQRKHVPVTMPILVGIDGAVRMSKSTGNFIGLTEAPEEQYGKAMSIPDGVLANYFELATSLDRAHVAATVKALAAGERDPLMEKKRLARTIVTELHGEEAAARAEAHFERTVQRKEAPEEMPEAAGARGAGSDRRDRGGGRGAVAAGSMAPLPAGSSDGGRRDRDGRARAGAGGRARARGQASLAAHHGGARDERGRAIRRENAAFFTRRGSPAVAKRHAPA